MKLKLLILMIILFLLQGCSSERKNNIDSTIDSAQPIIEENQINQEIDETIRLTSNDAEPMYITLVDNYADSNDMQDFFKNEMSLDSLKSFNKLLREEYDYYEFTPQSVQLFEKYEGDTIFVRQSKDGDFLMNQEVKPEGENDTLYVTTLKTVQLGKSLYFENLDHILVGGFENNDFLYEENSTVSAILGYKYKDTYAIGDTFVVNFIFKDLEIKVAGFYKENTVFYLKEKAYELDTFICIPQFDIEYEPYDDADKLWQQRYYLHKNGGYIKIQNIETFPDEDKLFEYYSDLIKKTAKENNVDYDIVHNTYTLKFDVLE